jgi:hypothetical protein
MGNRRNFYSDNDNLVIERANHDRERNNSVRSGTGGRRAARRRHAGNTCCKLLLEYALLYDDPTSPGYVNG